MWDAELVHPAVDGGNRLLEGTFQISQMVGLAMMMSHLLRRVVRRTLVNMRQVAFNQREHVLGRASVEEAPFAADSDIHR